MIDVMLRKTQTHPTNTHGSEQSSGGNHEQGSHGVCSHATYILVREKNGFKTVLKVRCYSRQRREFIT